MLKTPDQVKKALRRLYDRTWAGEAVVAAGGGVPASDSSLQEGDDASSLQREGEASADDGAKQHTPTASSSVGAEWPQRIALGTCTKAELEGDFARICAAADRLRNLAAALGLQLQSATKLVGGTKQQLPTHLVAKDIVEVAAALGLQREFRRQVQRAKRMKSDFPRLKAEDAVALLRTMRTAVPKDVDFDLACRAARWFSRHDATGLTARQVPLEGFHAKWLDVAGRRKVVAKLAGLPSLSFKERPAQVRFTYLDPEYRGQGGRRFDSWVVGDAECVAYRPRVVIICENRDSALWFLPVEGGIAIMGDGFAGIRSVCALQWVRQAPQVFYWGDMDAAGLEILNGYRAAGLDMRSILMDMVAFDRYERFGTDSDKSGRPLGAKDPIDTPWLTSGERALYERLTSPAWKGVHRIEQERIPLEDALREVAALAF